MESVIPGVIIGVVGVAGGAIVVAFLRWSWKGAINQIVSDIERRILPKHRDMLDHAIEPIRRELTVNGGEGLKDRVISIEQRLANVEQQLEIRLLVSEPADHH